LSTTATENTDRRLTDEEKQIGHNRADFMRRFFSVAVSVGFASKITQFEFLSNIREITYAETCKALLLVFAMIVVVGSWEFYFRSLIDRPLKDMPRFVIDIIIVSFYIILLASTDSLSNFLLYIAIIMFLYVLWDIFMMKAYPDDFGISHFKTWTVIRAYKDGFQLKGRTGPPISLWWFGMFVLIGVLHIIYPLEFFIIVIGSAVIYVLYRMDKVQHWSLGKRLILSSGVSALVVATLLVAQHCPGIRL
jgi:hypothetical protein